jgi:electron transport complex protein RnfE
MGLGFAIALTLLGAFREVLGNGSVFGYKFIPSDYNITIFVLAPGAFFVLACLIATKNRFDRKKGRKLNQNAHHAEHVRELHAEEQ